jgi:aryl-alcohol dehydrogenase-like predicted oxidoreductase
MGSQNTLGGDFTFPGTSITVRRTGYGAMQLAGPHVFGPPKDRDAAIAVLREAVESGVDHIDTSDFYGPHITNQIIKEALHPYPENLTIVTKVGAKRGDDGSWIMDRSATFLRQSVEDNLRNLGLDTLAIVNLRLGGFATPDDTSLAEPLTALAELQTEGLIQHIGLSTVSPKQFEEARSIAKIVCVQNFYNVAHREDDAFIDSLNAEGVAYVPYFPLGGFSPLQSSELHEVATELHVTPMAVAQAWLLHRSPNILLIPGTSSVAHLRENLAAASLQLQPEILQKLDAIASVPVT